MKTGKVPSFLAQTDPGKERQTIAIFPNPAREEIQIRLPQVDKVGQLLLFNAQGKMVKEIPKVDMTQGRQSLSLHHLAPGVYFVHLLVDGERMVSRFVLTH